MTPGAWRRWARPVLLLIVVAGAVMLVTELLVPAVIAQAYRGESLEVFNRVFQGRDQHSLDDYLGEWERIAGTVRLLVVVLGGVIILWQWKVAALVRPLLAAQPLISPGQVLLLAAWFGAITGFAEAALLLQYYDGNPAKGFAWERVWMAPLASTLAFLLVGLALLLVARASGGAGKMLAPVALRITTVVFSWLLAYAVAVQTQFHLATYAAVVLSAGVATVFARASTSDHVRFTRIVRTTWPPIAAALFIAAAISVWRLPNLVEQRRLATHNAATGRPNVLLIVLDTQRASNMSLYGYDRETTPELRKFATRGVVFDRAIATAPWTLPSHASIFTGLYPYELTADIGSPLDESHPTLAEVLANEGYATAAFVANSFYTTEASGLARGFARYEDYPVNLATFLHSSWLARLLVARPLKLPGPNTLKRDETVTTEFLRWHATHGDRPYFAFLNYMGAHAPYTGSGVFRSPRQLPSNIPKRQGITPQELEGARAAYDNGIASTDREVGRLLRELDRRGSLESTVVLVTADHGEHLGEHGLQDHTNSLYMPLLHVPLVIAYPRKVPTAVRVASAVSLRDIPATVLELTGATPANTLGGRSLSRYWTGDPGADEPILSELNYWGTEQDLIKPWDPVFRGSMKSLVLGDLHYIRQGRVEELFNVANDPDEELNLKDSLDDDLRHLREILDAMTRPP